MGEGMTVKRVVLLIACVVAAFVDPQLVYAARWRRRNSISQ